MKRVIFVLAVMALLSAKMICAENYAVLITGETPGLDAAGVKNWNGDNYNPPRWIYWEFWNDTFLVWEMLWQYGWKDENIHVLFGNGQDWPPLNNYERYKGDRYQAYDIQHITDDSAYYQDVVDVFTYLDGKMTNDDFLFVWTFDHGDFCAEGNPPHYYASIVLMDREINDEEFAAMMPSHYKQRVFWMQQCNSGGFIPKLENDSTVILTSTTWNQVAQLAPTDDDHPDGGDPYEDERIGGCTYNHGEFDYHVLNAARMETVGYFHQLDSADTNPCDGFTSMAEIWNWENMKDYWQNQQHSDLGDIGGEIFLNIPPYPPAGFTGARVSNHARLSWRRNLEYDLAHYNLYKKTYTDSTQVYSAWFLLKQLSDTTYLDTTFIPDTQGPDSAWYKVAAVDEAGQQSEFSNIIGSAGFSTTQSLGGAGVIALNNGRFMVNNFPNPFNLVTTLSYSLPQFVRVKMTVWDTSGRLVATLVDSWREAGTHQVTFDGSRLTSGIYLYKLTAGQNTATGKMVLLK